MNNTIFCRTCGKELSSEAFMCPNCGTPIKSAPTEKQPQSAEPVKTEAKAANINIKGLSVVAFILAMIAFVTGIIFGALCYGVYGGFLFVISSMSILPALTGLTIAAYTLCTTKNELTGSAKAFATVSIVFSAIVLVFLFLTSCLVISLM